MDGTALKNPLLILSILMQIAGTCGGPMIIRLYFLHGGKKVWLSSFLQTGGWPILLIILILSYIRRRKTEGSNAKLFFMKPFLFKYRAFIGFLIGLDNYLYSYGASKLPVSTSSLVVATQLAFIAGFAFLLVKQKFTKYSITAIVMLTIGAAVLALHTSNDLQEGETMMEYVVGLLMTISAAALVGINFPLIELMYGKAGQAVTYMYMVEIQMVMCFFGATFCTIGMIISNDFKDISQEASGFEFGEVRYYTILVSSAIIYLCLNLGTTGVIFFGSSLLSGIIFGVLLPVTEILAVVFYQEKFRVEKGVALALSLSGFVSYFYGEIKLGKEKDQIREDRSPLLAQNC